MVEMGLLFVKLTSPFPENTVDNIHAPAQGKWVEVILPLLGRDHANSVCDPPFFPVMLHRFLYVDPVQSPAEELAGSQRRRSQRRGGHSPNSALSYSVNKVMGAY